jgi:hypothetical protein
MADWSGVDTTIDGRVVRPSASGVRKDLSCANSFLFLPISSIRSPSTDLSRPVVITVADAPAANRAAAETVADVVIAGGDRVDLPVAIRALRQRGVRSVLVEGGPGLNDQLAAVGLLDELCLTLSPMLVGGDARRILSGGGPSAPRRLALCSLCEEDGFLFLRLRPAQPTRPPQPSVHAATAVALVR